MKKRVLFLLLVLSLLLCLIPTLAAADPEDEADDPYYLALTKTNFPDARLRSAVQEKLQTYVTKKGGTAYVSKKGVLGVTQFYFYPFDNYIIGVQEDPNMKYTFTSIKGLELFPNLVKLDIRGRFMTSLNLSKCRSLQWVDCSENNLTSLTVSPSNAALQTLNCSYNPLKALDVSALTNLSTLNCSHSFIASLTLPDTAALTALYASVTSLQQLELPPSVMLQVLEVGSNEIRPFDLSRQTNLRKVHIRSKNITSLSFVGMPDLEVIDVSGNALTTLVLRDLPSLTSLQCSRNRLTKLTLNGFPKLNTVYCDKNYLASLDLTPLKGDLWLLLGDQTVPNQELTQTAAGYSFDLSPLVPDTGRVTVTTAGADYDSATGVVTFARPVSSFSYTYATGRGSERKDLPVTVLFPKLYRMYFDVNPAAVSKEIEVYSQSDGKLMIPYSDGAYRLEAGSYRYVAVLTYGDGSTETFQKTFTVSKTTVEPLILNLTCKPWITYQPQDATTHNGDKAKFTVQTSFMTKVKSYQWYSRTSETASWKKVKDGTKATLTVKGTATNSGTQYRCLLKSVGGKIYTDVATLTVKLFPPVVVDQPKDAEIHVGEAAEFTFAVEGEGLSFAWSYLKPGASKWATVKGGTSATLTVTGKADNAGYQYKCEAKNKDGSVTSDIVTLDVEYHLPEIVTQPKGAKVKKNAKVTFTVEANDPYEEELTFQWYSRKNSKAKWTKIKGATEATYSFKATAKKNGYQCKCDITNRDGTVSTKAVTLKVK